MTVVTSVCGTCIYYYGLTHRAAFKEAEISKDILGGRNDHSQTVADDHGLQYRSGEGMTMDERVKSLREAMSKKWCLPSHGAKMAHA